MGIDAWICPRCGAPFADAKERSTVHPVVTEIVPDAYGSGPFLHRLSIRSAGELDEAFESFVREACQRVGRRERLDRS